MCLGIPGQVVELSVDSPDLATVDVSGVKRAINVAMLRDGDGDGVVAGDWVLIHVGFAMSKLTAEELEMVQQSLQMMSEGSVQEIEAQLPSRRAAGRAAPETYERKKVGRWEW